MYTQEPVDKKQFTEKFNQSYSQFAKAYDVVVKVFPVWRRWIRQVLPHIVGPEVLEISFGTGYLLTQYANDYRTSGIDYNWELICTTKKNLQSSNVKATIQQANVEFLPYASGTFDTVVNTMAFSGYPDGQRAMAEICRVIKPSGRLVMVDIDYPDNQNWLGMNLARMWASSGDILRDMGKLFDQSGLSYEDKEVGGFGSVHLYVATKSA
ncbi:MAG: methyltransferase domain-containing protein [Chloroflexi bacterium]|nr:MAG: methyltransferase domain-containing protein [Chloroflexota bacterium]MBL1196008.1 methyltransferase domain-containing protein [Chloroflexota bacterium]NOH13302.1 methyltransferase domain-containing protein [Chloroflexota bacterium]